MNWLAEHWNDILAWIGGVVSCASIIVKLTPSTKDDGIVDKTIKVLDYFSVVQTKKNEEKLEKTK